jgi:hypothetical protein
MKINFKRVFIITLKVQEPASKKKHFSKAPLQSGTHVPCW